MRERKVNYRCEEHEKLTIPRGREDSQKPKPKIDSIILCKSHELQLVQVKQIDAKCSLKCC